MAHPVARWVYPRVGGGTGVTVWAGDSEVGLSPRGRGNLRCPANLGLGVGSIPAWAGEPVVNGSDGAGCTVYPRVGGGTFLSISPAPRGWRSIPAWAGEPGWKHTRGALNQVYPRVGGGTRGVKDGL